MFDQPTRFYRSTWNLETTQFKMFMRGRSQNLFLEEFGVYIADFRLFHFADQFII